MAGVIRGQGSVILVLMRLLRDGADADRAQFRPRHRADDGPARASSPSSGFLIGFVLSIGIALVQFSPNWWMVLIVFVVYMVGQFLEGNVLYPKLVGQSININPVWLMFALFAFALLFGFVGLLLAVPLAAITAVLMRYAVRRYQRERALSAATGRQAAARARARTGARRAAGAPSAPCAGRRTPRHEPASTPRGPAALRLWARPVASRGRFHRRRRQPAGTRPHPQPFPTGPRPLTLLDGPGQIRQVASAPHLGRARRRAVRRARRTRRPGAATAAQRRWWSRMSTARGYDERRCSICSTSRCATAGRC